MGKVIESQVLALDQCRTLIVARGSMEALLVQSYLGLALW